jgi:hypothetical protein
VQEQGARYNSGDMTRIAITQAAFDAIVGTMPFGEARFALGNAGYEPRREPFAFQHTDGTLEVTMTDGKPSGWTASGHGIVTLATGSLASLNGKKYEWTGKGTGPNVFEADYTFK